jgi:hypothetical protein
MMNPLPGQTLSPIKLAAKKLSGSKRRAFQAQVTKDYLGEVGDVPSGYLGGRERPWRKD